MGAMQNQERDSGKKRGRRGKTDPKKRLAGFGRGGKVGGADWGTCTGDKLLAVVAAITNIGGAITLGLSRDEGGHSLTLLLDGDKRTLWFNGDDDLDEKLDVVLIELNDLPQAKG